MKTFSFAVLKLNPFALSSHQILDTTDTIVALATPPGVSALAILRVSGNQAIELTNRIFKGKDLTKQKTHTLHFGKIAKGEEIIDEVLISVFVAPRSFTGENLVEISCHGSNYIVAKILKTLVEEGARYAQAGEFTRRAFLNGKFDLVQAEAIADHLAQAHKEGFAWGDMAVLCADTKTRDLCARTLAQRKGRSA